MDFAWNVYCIPLNRRTVASESENGNFFFRILLLSDSKDHEKVESLCWNVYQHCAFPENISKTLNLFIHFNHSKLFSVQS